MISLSPKVCNLLIQTTKANDIDTALHSVLSEYIQMKLIDLEKKRENFETKCESEYWEWEDPLTLLEHYESIKRGKEKMDLCFFLIAKGLWLTLVRQAWLVSLPNNITSSLRYENCELCYMY